MTVARRAALGSLLHQRLGRQLRNSRLCPADREPDRPWPGQKLASRRPARACSGGPRGLGRFDGTALQLTYRNSCELLCNARARISCPAVAGVSPPVRWFGSPLSRGSPAWAQPLRCRPGELGRRPPASSHRGCLEGRLRRDLRLHPEAVRQSRGPAGRPVRRADRQAGRHRVAGTSTLPRGDAAYAQIFWPPSIPSTSPVTKPLHIR
jgi:hypothetical protein